MDLKESLKTLPQQPGIYFFRNSLGAVIYVGKAKNLKRRVSQYFQESRNNSYKVGKMIKHIHSFEYITTDTELEAFLLECETIRTLKPEYNRMLKNIKGYTYIRIPFHEEYPKLAKVKQKTEDGSLFFGPFNSETCVDSVIEFINDHYPVRKCNTGSVALRNGSSAGCLNSQLGTCLAPCTGKDVSREYRMCIEDITRFLNGKDYAPITELREKMKSAASNLNFERAAKYRDQLRGIRYILNMQRLIRASRHGRNVLAAERYRDANVKLFFIKGNKLLHKESLNLHQFNCNTLGNRLRSLANSFFREKRSCELYQEDIDEAQIIYSYLKKKSNGIKSFNIPASRIDRVNYEKIAESILKD